MMLAGRERLNPGEKRPIYVEVDAGRGATLQVLSLTTTPAGSIDPSYRILNSAGTAVSTDFDMGFTSGATRKPAVWVNVDTAGLDEDVYTLELTFEAKGMGEGFVRRYVQAVGIVVQ